MVSYHYQKISMGFTSKDFKNPMLMYDARTRQLRVRIQHLQNFLVIAKHPFTRAVVKQELNRDIDEYVNRSVQLRADDTVTDTRG